MEYDGDTKVPSHYLVEPPAIEETMGEYLVHNKVRQLAISETHKYGHVTYFWNGNRSGKFDDDLETYIEIPSFSETCDHRPWMKAVEITDRLIEEIKKNDFGFIRVNYANGDMVGHTGDFEATVLAVEVLDLQLKRLQKVVAEVSGILVITADHGNADEMYQRNKDGSIKEKGGRLLVPFIVLGAGENVSIDPQIVKHAGISSVTSSCLELLGFKAPADVAISCLNFR